MKVSLDFETRAKKPLLLRFFSPARQRGFQQIQDAQ
jgi:hypothetical protein